MTYDDRLRAAEAWAAAYRARQAADAAKRRAVEAVKALRPDQRYSFLRPEADQERIADKHRTDARAALRAAEKALLQIVDPKPITLKGRTREVKAGLVLLIDSVTGVP